MGSTGSKSGPVKIGFLRAFKHSAALTPLERVMDGGIADDVTLPETRNRSKDGAVTIIRLY